MSVKLPIVYGALTLTGVNLLLRFVGTWFQVYLSAIIGPAGVGLMQLVLSVNSLCMTAGIAGSRTTAMYLTAEELGKQRRGNVPWVMSGCLIYCLVTSGLVSVALNLLAPTLAREAMGTELGLPALQVFACFLPVCCMCGVLTGYFTAADRIGTLACVEVAEQLFTMGITVVLLSLLPAQNAAHACRSVVLGSCLGNCMSLLCLAFLYLREKTVAAPRIPVTQRLLRSAVPLALADDLKAGISCLENLLVPRRLALCTAIADPLASFGILSGMVFPVIMFPSAILFSLAELLIPELARCHAAGSRNRIRYLTRRNLRVSLFYGLVCGGVLFVAAEPLCQRLYPGVEVARYLRWFALLVPMLYCDAITDGMTKGLGQQTYCVRYNILTNGLDVCFLYVLLPRFGLKGYYASFLVTHALNFFLSLRRLRIACGVRISPGPGVAGVVSAVVSVLGAMAFTGWHRRTAAFLGLFFSLCYLLGALRAEDVQWLHGLLFPNRKPVSSKAPTPEA